MKLDFYNALTTINLFIVVLLMIFFLVNKKGQRVNNRILSFLLFLFLLQIIHSFTTSNFTYTSFLQYHKGIFIIWITAFLIGPTIYLYLKKASNPEYVIKWTFLLHTVPYILFTLYSFYRFTLYSEFIIWKTNGFNHITIFLILVHNLAYIILTSKVALKNNLKLKIFFNELTESVFSSWLHIFLLSFIGLWVVKVYIFASIMVIQKTSWCAFTNSIYALALFGFVGLLLFMMLVKPELYFVNEKYKNHRLNNEEKLNYIAIIEKFMKEFRPYKDPEISLENVADRLKIPVRIVSQVINDSFHCTFKSYINRYRINECILRLSEPEYADIPVKEIMYESGFVSKSAFNITFKKNTGLSPVEFRRKKQSKYCNATTFMY